MGLKLERQKQRHILLSIAYKLKKILPLNKEKRFKLFLDLEWIFDRFANEESFRIYSEDSHPARIYSKRFILDKIATNHLVFDLGCKYGEISNYIAEKAKHVTAIDHDKDAINIAKDRYKRNNLTFENGEAYDYLSNQDFKYDVLILSHILEHLDDPKKFLSKFKQFFQFIYIEVPDFERHYLNQYRLDKNINLIYSDNDHVSEFDRLEIKGLLQSCGITIQKEEYRFGVQKLWCKIKKNETKQ
jgi:SAM-dependent methyltransferase|tara:strand:- start:12106 stop:12837 length:732 start_codon:yes stop_codon:yes gene_type:complete